MLKPFPDGGDRCARTNTPRPGGILLGTGTLARAQFAEVHDAKQPGVLQAKSGCRLGESVEHPAHNRVVQEPLFRKWSTLVLFAPAAEAWYNPRSLSCNKTSICLGIIESARR